MNYYTRLRLVATAGTTIWSWKLPLLLTSARGKPLIGSATMGAMLTWPPFASYTSYAEYDCPSYL